MIATQIRDYLRNFASIRDRVDEGSDLPGIYAGTVARLHKGECVVTSDITAEHFYHLGGEVSPRSTILQITCYSSNPAAAYSLAELVRDKLSGFRGDIGDAEETTILTATIVGTLGHQTETPEDASDRFIHSYTRDYELIWTTPVPTFA